MGQGEWHSAPGEAQATEADHDSHIEKAALKRISSHDREEHHSGEDKAAWAFEESIKRSNSDPTSR